MIWLIFLVCLAYVCGYLYLFFIHIIPWLSIALSDVLSLTLGQIIVIILFVYPGISYFIAAIMAMSMIIWETT
jgi:hypothetical protein